mgnify:CR=1 FL=1
MVVVIFLYFIFYVTEPLATTVDKFDMLLKQPKVYFLKDMFLFSVFEVIKLILEERELKRELCSYLKTGFM